MDQEVFLGHRPCQALPRVRATRPPSSGLQNVALAGCDVSYQSDLVRVDNLPVVDMWSPEEDHIWGALAEGCNSTCHSKAWGELEDRLRYFGLTFPWIDGSTKSFAGLGSSTKTLGKRNLPVCIQVGEDSLAGAMESHEVDTEAFNPLLVSLFAQAKVRLAKRHGTLQMLHWRSKSPNG